MRNLAARTLCRLLDRTRTHAPTLIDPQTWHERSLKRELDAIDHYIGHYRLRKGRIEAIRDMDRHQPTHPYIDPFNNL